MAKQITTIRVSKKAAALVNVLRSKKSDQVNFRVTSNMLLSSMLQYFLNNPDAMNEMLSAPITGLTVESSLGAEQPNES